MAKLQLVIDVELDDAVPEKLRRDVEITGYISDVHWGYREAKVTATVTNDQGEIIRESE